MKFDNQDQNPIFPLKRRKLEFLGAIVGIKELSRGIGPWAMPKDAEEPEDDQTVR